MNTSAYVYDPSPEQPDDNFPVLAGGYPDATLYGVFADTDDAEEFANAAHPDDESGSAVVLTTDELLTALSRGLAG